METPHNSSPIRVIEEIDGIDRLEPLGAYQSQLVALVRARLMAGVNALDVTAAVADANDSLTPRLLDLAESQLGPPPCRYAWLALGSHGRGEQVLSSDQDSALAYGRPRARRGRDRRVLRRLAALVVDALARAGIPRCTGGYMATDWTAPSTSSGDLPGLGRPPAARGSAQGGGVPRRAAVHGELLDRTS